MIARDQFHTRTTLAYALLAVCIGCGHEPATIGPRPDYETVADALGEYIDAEMRVKGIRGLSIALVDRSEIVWAEGFGYADLEDSIPATSNTVYRVGSVSKLFTDIAVMQLVERGELNLDTPVTEYLPDFNPHNPSGQAITLRHLMTHRSGMVREPPVGHYFDHTEPSLRETVSSLNSTELVYEPGTVTKYSNAAIAVVGYVLEHLKREMFGTYLASAVLDPLGMSHSAYERDLLDGRDLATGFMWALDGREFEAPIFELGMAPAGSMYSTVEDLGRFMSALILGGELDGGRVLERQTLEEMWTPQYADSAATSGFGIGFGISDFMGRRRVGHNGAIYGFATELAVLPEDEIGVVVVATKDFANAVTGRIADVALEMMLAVHECRELPDVRSSEPLAQGTAGRLRGRYESTDMGVELSEWAGRLFLQSDGGGSKVELRALEDTLLVDDVHAYGTRLTYRDSQIVLNGITLSRVPDSEPQEAPQSWSGLIGEYGWDHDILYVLERNGNLNVLIEWFLYYPMNQVDRDEFILPETGLYAGESVTFTIDEAGSCSAVRIGGVTFERRSVGAEAGDVFRIEPLHPVEELREIALNADPPSESREFRDPDLVEVVELDSTVRLDVRYASTNNFMSAVFYDEPRAFLQRPAAEALVRAQRRLDSYGYALMIHDAYRPWYVTKMFWDATPEEQKIFVANPASGSRHNRGAAVDVTLYDVDNGLPVQMTGGYDEFSARSYARYPGGTSRQRWLRELLRRMMESEDFNVYEYEWWHFDHSDWSEYPIMNVTFSQIGSNGGEH